MTEIDGVDTELLKALRVIRGDNDKKKDAGSAANSLLSKAIVTAIESQGTATTTQNAELLDAIKEQNMLLDGLTELLRKKALESPPKTTVVVVNKEPAQSVASTVAAASADNETTDDNKIIDEPEIAAALAAADAADKTEQAKTVKKVKKAAYVAPAKKPKPEPIKPRVITGPWAFVESDVALKRRNRVVKSTGQFKMLPKDTKKEDIPEDAFTPISNNDILKKEDSLFGKVVSNDTSDVLVGDSFGKFSIFLLLFGCCRCCHHSCLPACLPVVASFMNDVVFLPIPGLFYFFISNTVVSLFVSFFYFSLSRR
jgi:hypothetical protein